METIRRKLISSKGLYEFTTLQFGSTVDVFSDAQKRNFATNVD